MNVIDEISVKENFPKIDLQQMPHDLSFTTADGSPLHMVGMFTTSFRFGDRRLIDDVYVCKGVTKSRLLGSSLLNKFKNWGIDNTKGVFKADEIEVPLVHTASPPPRSCNVVLKKYCTHPCQILLLCSGFASKPLSTV